jgi:hypothetical protein
MNDIGEKIAAGIAAIIGLAVIALMLSNKANTVNVISAFFGGLSNLIGVAVSPVTGQSVSGLSAAGLSGGTWQTGSGGTGSTSAFSAGGSGGGFNIGSLLGGAGSLLGGSGIGSGLSGLFSGGEGGLAGGSGGTPDNAWAGDAGSAVSLADLGALG